MAYRAGLLLVKSDPAQAMRYFETAAAIYLEEGLSGWQECAIKEIEKLRE
jgi:hypothetical protein